MSDQAGGVAALFPPGRNPCPTSPGIRKQDLCVVGQMQPGAFFVNPKVCSTSVWRVIQEQRCKRTTERANIFGPNRHTAYLFHVITYYTIATLSSHQPV